MDLPVAPPKAVAEDHGAVAAEAVQQKAAGSPLASEVRSKVEPALGTDLSDVRVHDDPAAHSASAALSARAFAHGRDVFLGHGESPSDTRLVAHEAAHVVQQSDRHTRFRKRSSPSVPWMIRSKRKPTTSQMPSLQEHRRTGSRRCHEAPGP
jgi:hypothetical protein